MIFPSVSLIFITHNGLADTIDFLESVKNLNYPKEKIEQIMVDNASEDNSPQVVTQKYPYVLILTLDKNHGYAYAINRGIEKSQGEYIFILNNDVVLHPDCLKNLIESISQDKTVGAIGGKIYFKYQEKTFTSSGGYFNPWTTSVKQTLNPDDKDMRKIDWIHGCAILFPKKIIEAVGFWDEGFFLYFEDTDFCTRIKKAGYKILYYPKATLWHKVAQSAKKLPREEQRYYYSYSKFRYLLKNYHPLFLIPGLLTTFFYILYKRIFLKEKGPIYEWRAIRDNIKHLNELKRTG